MAKRTRKTPAKKKAKAKKPLPGTGLIARARKWFWRGIFGAVVLVVGLTAIYAVISPPTTPYMLSEGRRLGGVAYEFVPLEEIAPVMARSAVAAEDANFCLHWGLDVDAIRDRIETEAMWSKGRILELYLNVAEFDEGIFGVQAAAQHYFGVNASELSAVQAARLAAILPSPKTRSASNPSASVRNRASSILDGAATIRVDGRAACFNGE